MEFKIGDVVINASCHILPIGNVYTIKHMYTIDNGNKTFLFFDDIAGRFYFSKDFRLATKEEIIYYGL